MATIDYKQKIKDYMNSSDVDTLYKSMLINLFPELRESEGEKIRKALKEYFINSFQNNGVAAICGVHIKDILAWLEKQGEQNLANSCKTCKDEPKFRVGDTIHKIGENTIFPMVIEEIKNGEYVCDNNHSFINIKFQDDYELVEQKPADKVEPKFHEGDWVILTAGELSTTLQIVKVDTNKRLYWFNDSSYLPIVDEEWLQLWTIQDAKVGDILCTYECDEPKIVFILKGTPKKPYVLGYHCYYNIMYPHFESDSKKGCLAPNEEDIKPATKEQRDTLEKAMADAGYTFDFENNELKKIEQKPWSEEDRKIIIQIRDAVEDYFPAPVADKIKSWLNSLKDRVQPKQEWSEEDKKALKVVTDVFGQYGVHLLNYPAFIRWLKTLPNRITFNPYWKPSEEQMSALKEQCVCKKSTVAGAVLCELFHDLEKLRGE